MQRALRLMSLGLASAAVLFAAGCATNYPLAPAKATTANQKDYVIGPGDALNIQVWRNPEVSATVPVRPDGKVSTPLVEDIPATGKTPTELARDIETRLAKYIQQPVVTVVVSTFVGPASEQIRVVGQAAKPQAIPYRAGMTLVDVMIAVGGVTEFAAGNRATLLRTREGNKSYSIRLDDLLKGGNISANAEVLPGDIIIIPESWF